MKCQKDTMIVVGLFFTTLALVSGLLSDRIANVEAELSNRSELTYSIPHLESDISEIKQDIKDIKITLIEIRGGEKAD